MKKIIVLAFAAVSVVGCNNSETDSTTVETKDTVVSSTPAPPPPSTSTNAYAATDGDVTYRDNKVLVMRGGQWVEADEDIKLDNDVVIYRNGKVKKADKVIVLEDGGVVDRTGNFFDKSGRAIENAWGATKEGVKDAGKAVKKTAKKVGEKVEDAVDGKDDDKP